MTDENKTPMRCQNCPHSPVCDLAAVVFLRLLEARDTLIGMLAEIDRFSYGVDTRSRVERVGNLVDEAMQEIIPAVDDGFFEALSYVRNHLGIVQNEMRDETEEEQ